MMARVGSVSPEAFKRGERFSNGLSSVIRDKASVASTSRVDKLLGLSSLAHSTVGDVDDVKELEEEDVWETETRVWPEEKGEVSGYIGSSSSSSYKTDGGDAFRFFNNGRRWLGLEKDPGLSGAFADGGRARGLSAISPLKLSGLGSPSRQVSSREGTPGRLATPSRLIPHLGQSVDNGRQVLHQSAPVNVPDWTKILGDEKKSGRRSDDLLDEDKDDDGDDARLPPHELLARSQISTFSVCEGAGRTLKGRDISRVRNAVLRQTGFLDS